MKIRRGTLFCLVVLAVMLVPASASAYEPLGRWQARTIHVYSTANDGTWRINRAIAHWNAGSPVELVRVYTPCSGCITIRESDQPLEPTAMNPWDGLAYPYVTSGTMTECLILLQPVDRPRRLSRAIATHEIGHCLGLNHSNAKWSIMGPFSGTMVTPRRHDFEKLADLYS